MLSLSLGLLIIGKKMCSTLLDVDREAQSADCRWESARQHQVLSMRLSLLTVREMSLTMPSVERDNHSINFKQEMYSTCAMC